LSCGVPLTNELIGGRASEVVNNHSHFAEPVSSTSQTESSVGSTP
jgi:hypothetical protein